MSSKSFSPILRLPEKIDFRKMDQDFERLGVYSRFTENPTVSLLHRPGATDPWLDGLTAHVLNKNESFFFSEGDFSQLNPGLENSYFSECLATLKRAVFGRIGRVRLFNRSPQTSSTLHQDLDIRLHLALSTTEKAFLVYPGQGIFHVPCDNHLYLVDTTRPHFAVNTNSAERRLHLVCSTYCGFREERGMENEILNAARQLFLDVAAQSGVVQIESVTV